MADGIKIDLSEVQKLAADLGKVPENAGPKIRAAVEVTARRVKDDWSGKLEGAHYLPYAAKSISYDVGTLGESVFRNAIGQDGGLANTAVAEIGPRIGGQGSLVGIVEYGSPTLAPRGYGAAALAENQDDFETGLSKALEDAEREAGL